MTDIIAHPASHFRAPAPPKLDPLLVILTAQVAHQMQILTQQGPTPSPAYRDPSGRPDAIGASLPTDYALYYATVPVPALPLNPPLPLEQLTDLSLLQLRSDQWARSPSDPRLEAEFLRTLTELRGKYARPGGATMA